MVPTQVYIGADTSPMSEKRIAWMRKNFGYDCERYRVVRDHDYATDWDGPSFVDVYLEFYDEKLLMLYKMVFPNDI